MDSFVQLMREWPPGYGGVERVAHELASEWGATVFSFDAQSRSADEIDALQVSYPRVVLPASPPFGRLLLPLPSRALWSLLRSRRPLYGHLPSPGVLLVLLLARLLQPRRPVFSHWHCFVAPEPGSKNRLFAVYQWLALRVVPHLTKVITTSPVLAKELIRCGCQSARVAVLPCCLNAEQEKVLLALPLRSATATPLRVLFIGRLDSYKRLDWLMEALSLLNNPWSLAVVGDGPRRLAFEALRKKPQIRTTPSWLVPMLARLILPFNVNLGSFLAMLGHLSKTDATAPTTGKHRLGDFFQEYLAKDGASLQAKR